jgi:hypothetical protein
MPGRRGAANWVPPHRGRRGGSQDPKAGAAKDQANFCAGAMLDNTWRLTRFYRCVLHWNNSTLENNSCINGF